MIKLKKIISESAWNRKFGEPLPTLKDVMEKKECDCGCGGVCSTVTEGPDEQRPADKEVQRIVKLEGDLRKRVQNLEQIFLRDGNPKSVKLAKNLTKSYKQQVTKFMREMISIRKKFK